MTFLSPAFVVFFVPAAVGAFSLACRWRAEAALGVLLLASVGFAWASEPRGLAFLLASLTGNFVLMRVLLRLPPGRARRGLTGLGVCLNLLPLVLFKWWEAYRDAPLDATGGVQSVLVPLGLSFYTLQQITYLIDAQRGDAPPLSFGRYAAWGTLFAQLPAGPVAAYGTMADQYAGLGRAPPSGWTIACGTTLFLTGIVKKLWLADPLGWAIDGIWAAAEKGPVAPAEAWTLALGFLLQLYLDFSAYSDMAIGLGLCFGIRLPINFDSPLKAPTPGEYLMRWHMSLIGFFRAYVFAPAFRALRGLPIRSTERRYALAWSLATVAGFVAVGAWHSFNPTLLVPALAVGLLVAVLQLVRARRTVRRSESGPVRRGARGFAWRALGLIGAAIMVLFLRAGDTAVPLRLIGRMFDPGAIGEQIRALQWLPVSHASPRYTAFYLTVCAFVVFALPNTMEIFGLKEGMRSLGRLRWRPSAPWGIALVGLVALALVGVTDATESKNFIYARF